MDMGIRPLTEEERKYTYNQSHQLTSQTGCIGCLSADLGKDGRDYHSYWDDKRGDLKTPEFTEELNEVINALRFGDANGGILKSRQNLNAYFHAYPECSFGNGTDYGIRIDTDKYAIFFDWGNNGGMDHVGIVEYCEGGIVHTIEGNTGDACKRKQYSIENENILGYGLPVYKK